MKNIVFLLLLSFGLQSFAQQYPGEEEISNLTWLTDFDEAKQLSATEKKPILMYFTGSDWCGPCKMLKKDFFSTEKFEKLAEQMILVKVDIPRRVDVITKEQLAKNQKLVTIYNTQGGYPNLVALNEEGHILGELSGYTMLRETDRHFAFVEAVIENY